MTSRVAHRLPSGVTLVPITTAHVPRILALQAELFGADSWSAEMLEGGLRAGHHYRGAVINNVLIGYAGLAVLSAEEAWVQSIGVHRAFQGQGIGTFLLETLFARAGNRRVGLEVAIDNPAQRLYARHGFEVVGIRHHYYQPSGKHAVVMVRQPPGGDQAS